MRAMIVPALLLAAALTACAAPAQDEPVRTEPPPAPQQEMAGAAVMAQAPETFTYQVELVPHSASTQTEDGVTLVECSIQVPVMTVRLENGETLMTAANDAEAGALAIADTFNSQFASWSQDVELDETTALAREDHAMRMEEGLPWYDSYALELTCSVYQTAGLVSVAAEYYSYTGGAHPNTALMAWNYDLTTGNFIAPELLAEDGQVFSLAVQEEIVRQCQTLAAESGLPPEDLFWSNYPEIAGDWSSYAVSFDEEGMTVGFSPYELASYAAGPMVYHLDYGQLDAYLSPHGRELLGLAQN